jgi:hypothetical protein
MKMFGGAKTMVLQTALRSKMLKVRFKIVFDIFVGGGQFNFFSFLHHIIPLNLFFLPNLNFTFCTITKNDHCGVYMCVCM